MGRTPIAQLVVMDDGAPGAGQPLDGVDIVVGATRPAVQDNQRRLVAAQYARYAIPSVPIAKVSATFAYGSNSPAHDLTSHPRLYPLGGIFGEIGGKLVS